jgi:uncharacterized membrane protein YvbJ
MITCQACGTENSPDAAFCSNCARKLDPETQNAVVQQRAAHVATGIRWSSVIVAGAVVLVIVVVIVLLVTHVL